MSKIPFESPSTQKFQAHAIHSQLEKWRHRLPEEQPDNFRELPVDARNAFVRLRWVLRYFHSRLQKCNPMLVTIPWLDSANQQLTALESLWSQYKATPNQYWQQLDNHIDGMLPHFRNIGPLPGNEAWQELLNDTSSDMQTAIEESRTTAQGIQESATSTEGRLFEVTKELKTLEGVIETQKTRLDAALNTQNDTFLKSEQARQTTFTQSQDQRTTEFTALAQAFTTEKTALIEETEAALAATQKESEEKSQELVDHIKEQLDKAENVVGTIVKTSMSGTYKIIADREYRNAWGMRLAAIAAFVAMGGMVIWAVSEMKFTDNGIDWSTFAIRLSLGFAFIIPGYYCAKESARHWASEKHNRRLALELAALDPFLAKLDEEKQKEIFEKKADEYFGQGVQTEPEEGLNMKDIHLSADQLLKLVDRVAAIIKIK